MMDKKLFLCRCMHLGPVFEKDLGQTVPEVSGETVKQILNSAIEKYGSCAVLAIDTDLNNAIIGLLFFYPKVYIENFNGAHPCIQEPKELNKIELILDKIISAPTFDEIKDKNKILCIECMQVVRKSSKHNWDKSYNSMGIGDGMLAKLISWARDFGWKKIQSVAIPNVKPLKLWWGNQTLNGFLKRGFTIIEDSVQYHKEVLEAVNNMKKGLHGLEIQKMWKKYENLSDKDLIKTYQVELVL